MNARQPLPTAREAIVESIDNMLRRQHHSPNCAGCDLCRWNGDHSNHPAFPEAQDLDLVGRVLKPGT